MDIENKIDPNFIFKNRPEEYHVSLSPLKDYFTQAGFFLGKMLGVNQEQANKYISRAIKENKGRNPIVKFNKKNEYGDMEVETDTLTNYIKETVNNGEVMVPSFTTYIHPTKKKSLHAEFLQVNIKKRKEDKENAFKYKQLGDDAKALYYNTMQKIRKIFNNSLSGAYASKSTILCNPSAHYTLTSMTRCVASIGNMTSESMVAGNKYFKDPEVTINYIIAISSHIGKLGGTRVIDKYKIHIPTPEEVFDAIMYSSRNYWRDEDKEQIIMTLLRSLDDVELCSVLYSNDFWHFMKYNDAVARDIVTGMSAKLYTGSNDPLTDIKKAPEGVANLVHHICMDEIKGKKINYDELVGNPLLMLLGSTAKGIVNTMIKYGLFFKIFYTTEIMPTSIAYIKDMLRDTIVLSDTDSTCGSYDKWVEWYFGGPNFTAGGTGVAAAVMTINTQVMDHHLKIFARNMNIDKSLVELLKMKNEFYWSVFVATNVSKHYFADTEIQEGNVFKESELELKGVHLIASSIRPDLAKFSHDMMTEITGRIKTEGKISLREYLVRVADKERELIKAVKSGDVTVYKTETIKDEKTYKNDGNSSPYRYYTFWQDVFADKYGTPGGTPIQIIKVPLRLPNKSAIRAFLETIEDTHIKNKLTQHLENKTDMKVLRVPALISEEKGIPEEFVDYIDVNKIVEENLKAVYYVLEAIGFYRKEDLLVSELGY